MNGKTKIAFFGGKKQWGKTTACTKTCEASREAQPRTKFWFLDNGRAGAQFSDWENPTEKTLPQNECVVYEKAEDFAAYKHKKVFKKPYHICKGDITYAQFMKHILATCGLVAVIDEIDTYIDKTNIDFELNEICQRGAHKKGTHGHGISLFAIARRTQNVHNTLLSQADHTVLVKVTNGNDLKTLNISVGIDKDQISVIKGLEIGDVRRYDDNDLSTAENIFVVDGLSQPYPDKEIFVDESSNEQADDSEETGDSEDAEMDLQTVNGEELQRR